ncbi:MAG: DNA repair protein RecN [Caldisericia bacterium]|nr:DNA repair protein RecN [Caldisericia bacterium]
MLTGLSVSNFAIVDRITLDLTPGLTVITGETGAGKSILIGALLLGLGERWLSDSIRPGQDRATIELLFKLKPGQFSLLNDADILEDGELIVSRSLDKSGRGRVRLGGISTTISGLKGAVSKLVDVHSQFEAQSLLRPEIQLKLLDNFAGSEHLNHVSEFGKNVSKLRKLGEELDRLQKLDDERLKRIDFIQFELDEFERIKPQESEDEELHLERDKLSNVQKLAELAGNAKQALDGGDDFSGINSLVKGAGRELQELSKIDSSSKEILEYINTIEANATEANIQLSDYLNTLTFNPERLEEIEGRLAELEKMIRRHGNSLVDVFEGVEKYETEIKELRGSEKRISELDIEIRKLRETLGLLGIIIRETRESTGEKLAELVESQLADLALENSTFKLVQAPVLPTEKTFCVANGEKTGFSEKGLDVIEFYVSTNTGMPAEPIKKVASGGELSRIMLALKVILAEVDSVPTLIFDEVDAGVGGRVGEMIGRKLAHLATKRQVICITHLSQIAVFADTHLRIIKSVEDGETTIGCTELAKRGQIEEIARMGSGDKVSQVSLKHAQEMLIQATKFKQSI